MDLFGRYLFRQTASSFLLITLTLTAIIWLAIGLRDLDLLTSQGQSAWLFLNMTALAIPSFLTMIAPVAFLVACLYGLDRFNGDSELIIMSASGAPIWRFATPLLALAALISASLIAMNFYITPLSLRTLHVYVTQVRSDLISQVLNPGRFSSPESGLTIHIRDRAPNDDLLGLMVHDTRTEGRAMTYLAKRGHIVSSDEGAFLIMRDGQIHRRTDDGSKDNREVNIGEFKEYFFDISQFEPNAGAPELKPRERFLPELLYPDKDDGAYQNAAGQFRSEIHDRFSSLLYPFVFAMITLNFLGHPRTIRETRWRSITLAFGAAVIVRIVGLAATNFLVLQPWAVVLVYGIPMGAILVAAAAAHVRMAPYAWFKLDLDLPAKFQIHKYNFWAASGVKTEEQRGRVG